ncbi:hypothetical protein QAD02_018359 [Eretmocerus hayati]|uniref:Uncharacterized protein n=1 Tax=Eretmocerus hayati TaxID=131215 RepID=A0ACC2PGU0_9HYME|nr:hypothetical protein QAD02_018359 [Eretmocerus hayati]
MFLFSTIIATSFILSANSIYTGLEPKDRNIDGLIKNTRAIKEFPYHVSFVESLPLYDYSVQSSFMCAGAIVSPQWIISSASCVTDQPIDKMIVRSGTNTWNNGGISHNIREIIPHPKYNASKEGRSSNNIAMIRISPKFEFNVNCSSIDLFKRGEDIKSKSLANATGMGQTEISPSSGLMMAKLEIKDWPSCDFLYRNFGGIANDQFCVGYKGQNYQGPCYGDGGSPLVIKNRLAGIFAWQKDCPSINYPPIYTRISSHRDWIMSYVLRKDPEEYYSYDVIDVTDKE